MAFTSDARLEKTPGRRGQLGSGSSTCPIGARRARFSITLDHHHQRVTKDNLHIVQAIANGAGINDIARILAPAGTGRAIGISRVYNRIFATRRRCSPSSARSSARGGRRKSKRDLSAASPGAR
jgi:hypothetical protein